MSENLGNRIKKIRKALDMTQTDFAKAIGVSKRAVQEWEAGRRSPSEPVLRQIEQTFNVNPEWLREGKGEMFVEKGKPEKDPLEVAAERIVNIIVEKRGIKISEEKKRKVIKKLAELLRQVGEKEALDLIDIAV